MGARASPRAVDRGAGRAYGLGDARSGRACLCAPQERFASPCTIMYFAPIGPIGPKRGPIVGTVCRARKMRKVYWHITFYTS